MVASLEHERWSYIEVRHLDIWTRVHLLCTLRILIVKTKTYDPVVSHHWSSTLHTELVALVDPVAEVLVSDVEWHTAQWVDKRSVEGSITHLLA